MKFNNLIPELNVSDIGKSLDFYVRMLGFRKDYERKESKFAFLSYKGSQLMMQQGGSPSWSTGRLERPYGRGINFQIETDDVDGLVCSLIDSKYPIKLMPKENWYRVGKALMGNKEFLVMDPDGYLLRFAQDLGKKKAK
jgi:catechol 2,3-dioxygenase-like lactoylglutathione lyase family enzyme